MRSFPHAQHKLLLLKNVFGVTLTTVMIQISTQTTTKKKTWNLKFEILPKAVKPCLLRSVSVMCRTAVGSTISLFWNGPQTLPAGKTSVFNSAVIFKMTREPTVQKSLQLMQGQIQAYYTLSLSSPLSLTQTHTQAQWQFCSYTYRHKHTKLIHTHTKHSNTGEHFDLFAPIKSWH